MTTQRVSRSTRYYKFFDKNWSFLGNYDGKLMFLDWFYENGVHAILLDPDAKSCKRKVLVEFKKDVVPKDHGPDGFPAFSVGSTTLQLKKSKNIDVLGVGHVKFVWGEQDCRLAKDVMKIDAMFDNTFANKYRRHFKHMYASFFFRVTEGAGGKFRVAMSDLWIPFLENEKKRYHTLVMFPMSVFGDKDVIHVSAGMSDFYNVIYTFNKKSVLKSLVHDVSKFDRDKLKIKLIRPSRQ